jgi:hypothetical protein
VREIFFGMLSGGPLTAEVLECYERRVPVSETDMARFRGFAKAIIGLGDQGWCSKVFALYSTLSNTEQTLHAIYFHKAAKKRLLDLKAAEQDAKRTLSILTYQRAILAKHYAKMQEHTSEVAKTT